MVALFALRAVAIVHLVDWGPSSLHAWNCFSLGRCNLACRDFPVLVGVPGCLEQVTLRLTARTDYS